MNIVIAGARVQVYGEDVKTYKALPIASYDVQFNKMAGFYLTYRNDLVTNEEKIYGNHEQKVDKVFNSFSVADRNFGIILSGQKGIGKSLFARILAQKSIASNIPVITVSGYIPGIADFIGSIEQEVLVIFDEFEKTFGKTDNYDPQEEMLSLFDGLDNGKKLFCITCNEIGKLNSYLLNRPGRFHYHFVITNPSEEEITEYLTDKLDQRYHHNIERVVNFARTINMTYDYLRAIAFELNQGYTIEESLEDLNITRSNDVYFDIVLTLSSGQIYSTYNRRIDLYKTEDEGIRIYGRKGSIIIHFTPSDIKFENGSMCIDPTKVETDLDEDDYWELPEDERNIKIAADRKRTVRSLILKKCNNSDVNRYLV